MRKPFLKHPLLEVCVSFVHFFAFFKDLFDQQVRLYLPLSDGLIIQRWQEPQVHCDTRTGPFMGGVLSVLRVTGATQWGCGWGATSSSITRHRVLAEESHKGGGVFLGLSNALTNEIKGYFSFLFFLMFKVLATFFLGKLWALFIFCCHLQRRWCQYMNVCVFSLMLFHLYLSTWVSFLLSLSNCFMLNMQLPQPCCCFLGNCCFLSNYRCVLICLSFTSSSLDWESSPCPVYQAGPMLRVSVRCPAQTSVCGWCCSVSGGRFLCVLFCECFGSCVLDHFWNLHH